MTDLTPLEKELTYVLIKTHGRFISFQQWSQAVVTKLKAAGVLADPADLEAAQKRVTELEQKIWLLENPYGYVF